MGADLVRDLRGASILLIHRQDQEAEELVRQLRRIGCQVRLAWPPPATLPSDVNVVLFEIHREGTPYWPPEAATDVTLIAIIDYENPTALQALIDTNACGVVIKPVRAFGILASLVLARSLHGYQNRLQAKVAKLEETLKSRRDIERATRILMQVRGLSEEKAYQLVRQQATVQRIALGVVARSIITSYKVFEDPPPASGGAQVIPVPRGPRRSA